MGRKALKGGGRRWVHFPQPGPRDHNQSSFKGGTIIWGHVGDHMILCSVDVSCLRIGIPPELGSREKLRIFCRTKVLEMGVGYTTV